MWADLSLRRVLHFGGWEMGLYDDDTWTDTHSPSPRHAVERSAQRSGLPFLLQSRVRHRLCHLSNTYVRIESLLCRAPTSWLVWDLTLFCPGSGSFQVPQ